MNSFRFDYLFNKYYDIYYGLGNYEVLIIWSLKMIK